MSTKTLDVIVRLLHDGATTDGGRIYAGGLVKFEPKELERIAIPRLEILNELTDEMDNRRANRRLSKGSRSFSA